MACNNKCGPPHVRYTFEVVAFLSRTTQSSISSSSLMCWSKLFLSFIEVKHAAKVVFISELILFNWFCCFRIKNIMNYANWIHFCIPHVDYYTAAGTFHYAENKPNALHWKHMWTHTHIYGRMLFYMVSHKFFGPDSECRIYTNYYYYIYGSMPLRKHVCLHSICVCLHICFQWSSVRCVCRGVFVNMCYTEMNLICIIDGIFYSKTTESIK